MTDYKNSEQKNDKLLLMQIEEDQESYIWLQIRCLFLARGIKSRRAYVVTQSLASALASALAPTSLLIIATIPIQLQLLYLPYTCLGTRPFHACQNLDPCDLDIDLRVCV